jgi:hypothetical protein
MEYFETEEHKQSLLDDFYSIYEGEVYNFTEDVFERGVLNAHFENEHGELRFLTIACDKFGKFFNISTLEEAQATFFNISTLEEAQATPDVDYDNLRYSNLIIISPFKDYKNIQEFIKEQSEEFLFNKEEGDLTDVKGLRKYSFGVGYARKIPGRHFKETVLCEEHEKGAEKVYYLKINE